MHVPAGLILRPEFQNPGGHAPTPQKTGGAPTGGGAPSAAGAGDTGAGTNQPTGPGQKQPSFQEACLSNLPLMLGFIAIFYFLLIRPQQKQEKQRRAMLAELSKDAKVVMNSGLHGTIVSIDEQTVTIRVDHDVKMKFDRSAVGRVQGDDAAPGTSPQPKR